MKTFILGSYPAAPKGFQGSADERAWYDAMKAERLVGGLELPFATGLHPLGVDHLIGLLDPTWSSVVTALPGIAAKKAENPSYGLASDDEGSRADAIADIAQLRAEVVRVRDALGPAAIIAVELHSAPSSSSTTTPSSVASFQRSLEEIAGWAWDDVALTVEHCDSVNPAFPPQKGFLSLGDELRATEAASASTGIRIGHTVNWGRSALEARDADRPREHAALLSARGVLSGVVFSGVSPDATPYGPAWVDGHLPSSAGGAGAESTSLLTVERMASVLAASGELGYLGVKVSAPKVDGLSLADRLAPGLATLRSLAEASPVVAHTGTGTEER